MTANPSESESILDRRTVARIAGRAFPGRTLAACETLSGGVCNTNIKFAVSGLSDAFVLRVYRRDPEACRKEVDLHRLVAGRVPVPEIVHADSRGGDDVGPHVVMRWIEGVTLRDLASRGDPAALAEAAYSTGETLAKLGAFAWPSGGWLGAGPAVSAPFDLAGFLAECLAAPALAGRLAPPAIDRLGAFLDAWVPRLERVHDERQLVHGDFGGSNLLVRPVQGAWRVVGVLDWEFACAGTPLVDVGHVLRYERPSRPRQEPHFSRGFLEGGGVLGEDWRAVARAVDLLALCDLLARPGLSEVLAAEVAELVSATVEGRERA